MTQHNRIPSLVLAALCTLSVPAFAAGEESVNTQSQGAGVREVREGDKLPDEYKRETLAVKDWRKHGLSAPGEDEQWVAINDKYVLVSIPNGTAKQMVDKKK